MATHPRSVVLTRYVARKAGRRVGKAWCLGKGRAGKGREGGPGSRMFDKSVKIGWRKDTFESSGRCGIMPYLFSWFERDVFESSNSSSAALDYRSPSQQCVGISALPVHDGNFEA